jgi:DNA end-binding protein Ku
MAPDSKVGLDAFAVSRDAIRDKGMFAVGRVVLTRREHPVMIEGQGLARDHAALPL